MLLFSALVAGSFALGGRIANQIDPLALTAARFLVGAISMSAFVLASGLYRPEYLRGVWRYSILGALMATYFALMFKGLQTATPVSTSAVFTLTPIASALFGWWILGQVTTRWSATALGIGAAGALWVIFRADFAAFIAFDIGTGESIFFWGCIAHALYAVAIRKFNRGEPTSVSTAGMLITGAIILGIVGHKAIARTAWLNLSSELYWVFLYLALVTTAVTFFLVQYAAMRLPASKVMAYTYLTPSFVILWEAGLGNPLPNLKTIVGILLTGLALLMLLRK